jgi:hypothetical protein
MHSSRFFKNALAQMFGFYKIGTTRWNIEFFSTFLVNEGS